MKRMLKMGLGCLALVAISFFCGCSHLGKTASDTSSPGQADIDSHAPAASYMDFNDVLIPYGLKVDSKESFVLRSSGQAAGVLVLKGRVDKASLINFFEINMAKDNWQLVSTFKLPRTLMLYHKDTRYCIISVFEGRFSTKVEIWVSPPKEASAAGLLK